MGSVKTATNGIILKTLSSGSYVYEENDNQSNLKPIVDVPANIALDATKT